ncbi:MAG: YHS domain-containing protein [Candidatus Omnitrophota bacterium]
MVKRLSIFLVGVILILGMTNISFAMMCAEHSVHGEYAQAGQPSEDMQTQEADTKTAASKTVVAEEVGNTVCPVSGEKIDEKTKATYEYDGKIYNFCCTSCIEEFKKDPQKYIQKIAQEKQEKAAEGEKEQLPQEHEHSHM